jgi:hypothetical protein
MRIAEVYERVAASLGISSDDRAVTSPSGSMSYESRVRWAFTWLNRAGLGHSPSSGEWELTAKGRELAASHPVLSEALFDKYDEKVRPSSDSRKASSKQRPFPGKNEGRKAYRLPAQPLAEGGQSRVYLATRKSDGQVFAMKRAIRKFGENRMKREIEVQTALSHPNIMPIIDWDKDDFLWFVMPMGIRTMASLTLPLHSHLLMTVLKDITEALRVAHDAECPHRDIKPDNIIELANGSGTRWVLADWGLTRRPLGQTTSPLTRSGHVLGTEGFAAPEAYFDSHAVGPPADIYSIGQVIAWATGVTPVPNVSPVVDAPWRDIVARATRQEQTERPQTILDLQKLLSEL